MKNTLKNLGYRFDDERAIWRHPEYRGISYNDGDEIETRIGGIIASSEDISVLSTELRGKVTDWASLYHLSSVRSNILRPYQKIFKGDVLEIGAGCGAITRYLGEQGANILALEGSPRRASIARSRTRDLENVTVLSERFDQFKTDQTFDVITLIGVLEYANLFTPGDEPALNMLKRVRQLLKPTGQLIIAIENQLGLKYFAGAPEDHLGTPMYGVEGRYQKDQPQTFGKKVLEEMLVKSELSHSQFMAPFPDYKLPTSIVTESGFKSPNFDAAAFAWQSVKKDHQLPPCTHFSLELAWADVVKNGLGLDMANSFLILASPAAAGVPSTDILAYHYSAERLASYCKETLFISKDHDVDVVHFPLKTNFNKISDLDGPVNFLFPESQKYSLGKTLSWEFIQIVSRDGWTFEEVGKYFKRYVRILEGLISKDGGLAELKSCQDLVPAKYFDGIPQNIVITPEGAPIFFDTEWVLKTDIELGRVLLRAILNLLPLVSRYGKNISYDELTHRQFIEQVFSSVGINVSDDDINYYIQQESEVQNQIYGRPLEKPMEWGLGNHLNFLNTYLYSRKKDQEVVQNVHTISQLNDAIRMYENSKSWILTRPLRKSVKLAKKISSFIKNLPNTIRNKLHLENGVQAQVKSWLKILRDEGFVEFLKAIKKFIRRIGTEKQSAFSIWLDQYSALFNSAEENLNSKSKDFERTPLISIVMPVYKTNHQWLKEAIESVIQQSYPHWELCIADDASQDGKLREILESYAAKDARIKVYFSNINEHISAASNHALTLATGEWVGLLDHDDLLDKNALLWIVGSINENPNASLIYSDEAKIDEVGNKFAPYFKPDWNRDLFYSQNYICHFGAYKTSILKDVGGFRLGFEGAQDYDLALRFIEKISDGDIVHVPRLLYYWRAHQLSTAQSGSAKNYAKDAGKRALQEHLDRIGIRANVNSTIDGYRVSYALPKNLPLVSLIIPTRNSKALVEQCIESIIKKTKYQNYEIILVDNGSDENESLNYFKTAEIEYGIRVIKYDGEFNYSAINNYAASEAKGELLCLVNNDIEVISPEWLGEMVSLAIQPRVGAVGAKLLYSDSSLQHGGVVLGVGGVAGHSHKYLSDGGAGYFNRANLISSYSAVTAACLLVRKELFLMVGGLNESNLKIAFNDVDFCLKLQEAGYANVWTPYAKLFHHESATRGPEDSPEKVNRFNSEVEYMKKRWDSILGKDPAYNPNLTLEREDFSLAFPPRM
ncbi:hypothetical protein PKF023_03240 [Polynucleobacter yangtzensis]|uniref:Glycosyltransferase, GT2 family n=1 Tax=Polynucleobacter yangtzensis TaxID=1743159 RepID=A0A9C7C965_9BURK|nr:glycosyltransferase [Polynucleobacter yangtzensis]BDT76521.1 hypothetical protein PKF023_03240 [Polynucleobacter yangtzensis]